MVIATAERVPGGRRRSERGRCGSRSARSARSIIRCADAEDVRAPRSSTVDAGRSATPIVDRVRRRAAAAAARPIDDHRSTADVSPPRDRGAGRPAAAQGVPEWLTRSTARRHRVEPALPLHVNGADHEVTRRVGRREPAVRAARAARAARQQGRVRAGRVRQLQRARRRRAGVQLPRARGAAQSARRSSPSRASRRSGRRRDVQQAFVDAGAVQCGFCTPGLIVAAHALLDRNADPTEFEIREELSGNVCRCTGYGRIIEAVQRVAVAADADVDDEQSTDASPRPSTSTGRLGDSPPRPTASPRCRARSPSPATCRPTGSCGARRCARRIPYARIVAHRRRRRRGASTASRRSSPPTTCRASRPTA